MNSSEKTRFRSQKKWKDFTRKLIKTRGMSCELFGVALEKGKAQVHHLDPANYDDLEPSKFKILSPTAHEFIEHIGKIYNGSKTKIPNEELMLVWLKDFLPAPEHNLRAIMEDLERIKKLNSKG